MYYDECRVYHDAETHLLHSGYLCIIVLCATKCLQGVFHRTPTEQTADGSNSR